MPGWEAQWLAPLAYSDMGLENIIADSLLESNPDSSLVLVLNQILYSAGADSVIPIPDSVFKDTFHTPATIPVTANTQFLNETTEKKMNLNGPELTQLILKQGRLDYTLKSEVGIPIIVTYGITCATKYGAPLQFVVNVPGGSQISPAVVSGSFDLSGADFDLRGSLNNDYNMVITELKLASAPNIPTTNVPFFENVYLDTRFEDLVAEYAKGYFGQQTFSIPYETISFNFLDNLQQAMLDIDSITATVYLSNGMGADARIRIDTLDGTNTYYNSTVLMSHNQFGVPVNINRATDLVTYAQPYDYSFTMNQTNSNIESFIENIPGMVGYSGEIEINPLGNVSNHTDFVRGNSKVEVGLNMRIPLNVSVSNVTLNDTIPLDLNSMDANGHFNELMFRLMAENGFPLQATVNIYMLDANKMSIGTLASNLIISSGTLNGSNVVIQPSNEIKEIYANDEAMEKLYRSKYLRISVGFQTAGTGKVQFYDYYRFKSKLIVDATYLTKE